MNRHLLKGVARLQKAIRFGVLLVRMHSVVCRIKIDSSVEKKDHILLHFPPGQSCLDIALQRYVCVCVCVSAVFRCRLLSQQIAHTDVFMCSCCARHVWQRVVTMCSYRYTSVSPAFCLMFSHLYSARVINHLWQSAADVTSCNLWKIHKES